MQLLGILNRYFDILVAILKVNFLYIKSLSE
jgi:hypothetical protein